MFALRRSLVLLCLSLFAAACGDPHVAPPGEVAASDKERLAAPAPPADLQKAVAGQNELAFDLYRGLAKDGENLFLSPVSISTALSMTYAGAAGGTAAAFEQVLGSGLAASAHHRAMNDLDAQLASRGQNVKGADGKAFRLTAANQLFAQKAFAFEVPFLDTLAQEYGANVRLLDFESAADPSRVAINEWVAKKTEDRIDELLPQGSINDGTRMVLVNAIYFNAAWRDAFEESATMDGDFHKADGTTVQVPMMKHPDLATRAAQVNGVEVFELPYDGDELSMLVILPPKGQLPTEEAALSSAQLDTYVAALASEHLELSFPRFELRTSANLVEPLAALGLGPAFSDAADFSAMSTADRLSITGVVHEAFVKVNEKGTEAAAATGVIVGVTSVPVTRAMVVDRPFVFAIRDNATGAVVFVGRVVDP